MCKVRMDLLQARVKKNIIPSGSWTYKISKDNFWIRAFGTIWIFIVERGMRVEQGLLGGFCRYCPVCSTQQNIVRLDITVDNLRPIDVISQLWRFPPIIASNTMMNVLQGTGERVQHMPNKSLRNAGARW